MGASSECKYACAERPGVVIEAIPASNDVNLPGLATTETLTRHVNLNYFSEAVSWEGEERLADADSWRITGNSDVTRLGKGCRRSGSCRVYDSALPRHSLRGWFLQLS